MIGRWDRSVFAGALMLLKEPTGMGTRETCSLTIHELHFFSIPRPGKRGCIAIVLSVTGLEHMLRPHISCPVWLSEC